MSEETGNRVLARSKARELTAEEMTQISAGGGSNSYCTGHSLPSGDPVPVEDDIVVNG
jgi:hypothetical protein